MKDWKKTLGLALVCAAFSMVLSVAITLIIRAKKVKDLRFKELLKELYPEHEWEHTGQFIQLWNVQFIAWYPEDFEYREGETEAEVKEAINARAPGLKPKVEFRPLADFDEFVKKNCCRKA